MLNRWMRAAAVAVGCLLVVGTAEAKPAAGGKKTVVSAGWTITATEKMGSARQGKGRPVVLWQPKRAERGCSEEHSGRLLSAVGALVSFEQSGGGYCEGAAHPWASANFVTLDLRTGKPVSLYDLFSKAEVDAAIAADPFLKKSKGDPDADCKFTLDDFDKSFAFVDLKGDKVGVRIGLAHGCEAARGNLTQIGVTLLAKEPLLSDLRAAEAAKTLYKHLGRK
ncbi:MAG: hypothetical protein HY902_09950 [Deltaproteobacteria bacterium]|nr:hypothetical protein [Deltaproteobacteria bacterium]